MRCGLRVCEVAIARDIGDSVLYHLLLGLASGNRFGTNGEMAITRLRSLKRRRFLILGDALNHNKNVAV
jgi:hypothetical protein